MTRIWRWFNLEMNGKGKNNNKNLKFKKQKKKSTTLQRGGVLAPEQAGSSIGTVLLHGRSVYSARKYSTKLTGDGREK